MFSYITARTSYIRWDENDSRFLIDQYAELYLHSGSSLHNRPRVDMSIHSDTLSWFRANQLMLFLLNDVCLGKKQHIPIIYSLVWHDRGSNSRSTELDVSTVTMTPPMAVSSLNEYVS